MLKPNARRGKIAYYLQIAMLIFSVCSIFFDYIEYAYLDHHLNGSSLIFHNIDASEDISFIFSILHFCIGIVSIVYLLMWFRRAYYNLEVLQTTTQYSNSWAVWGWLVPILNLYRPYRMMTEIYTGARNYFIQNNLSRETISLSWIGWWWGFSLINVFLIRFSMRMSARSVTLVDELSALEISMISSLISIVATMFTLIVMTDYMKAEVQIAELYKANQLKDEPSE